MTVTEMVGEGTFLGQFKNREWKGSNKAPICCLPFSVPIPPSGTGQDPINPSF